MRKYFRILILMIFACCVAGASETAGQPADSTVKYTPDFRFNDGVFLNFEQVKTNNPIRRPNCLPQPTIMTRISSRIYLRATRYIITTGWALRQEIDKNTVWGYSRNGILYIQVDGNFSRITFIGSICHFVADITTYDDRYYNNNPYGYYDPYYSRYYNPYYYYSPYYSPYSYNNYYSPYGPYSSPYRNTARNELRQYLIDFDTGKILEYDVDNAEMLLMKDNQLYEEYVRLPHKKKRDLIFVYIRKYNENNPLFIPVR